MKERETPPDFCLQVLRLLHEAGILGEVIIIGSWCNHFYRKHIPGGQNIGPIRTGDLDILIPKLAKVKSAPSISKILGGLGFIVEHSREGHTRLIHPLMVIDFLVPERGRGHTGPVKVPGLGVNASGLRLMDFLAGGAIVLKIEGMAVRLPDPVRFALHKLFVSERRSSADKAARDRNHAMDVLRAVAGRGDANLIRELYASLHKGWKAKIIEAIKKAGDDELMRLLTDGAKA